MEEMAEQHVVFENPIPKLELSLDDLELGSEIDKLEQNMILGPRVKQKREGSDDSAMTIDYIILYSNYNYLYDNSVNFGTYP